MRSLSALVACLSAAAFVCAASGCPGENPPPPADPSDGGGDAPIADSGSLCRGTEPFDPPVLVGVINLAGVTDRAAHLSPDQRTIYFMSTRQSTPTERRDRIHFASRATAEDTFSAPTSILLDNLNYDNPSVTGDEKTLLMNMSLVNVPGGENIKIATRTEPSAYFGTPSYIQGLRGGRDGSWEPYVMPDSSAIYYRSREGIFVATRLGSGFSESTLALTPPPGWFYANPVVSVDELTIWISASEIGKPAGVQVATRKSKTDAFGAPQPVPELNAVLPVQPDWISPDGCALYLTIPYSFKPTDGGNEAETHIFRSVRRPR